jgi:hypothetical protein
MLFIVPLAMTAMVVLMAVGAWAVQLLWNWLLPPLFGWRTVGFWQALGLLALCRILFGGLGGHGPGPRRHWRGRCKKMTPEEREKFRQAMAEGYGFGSASRERATS